MRKLINDRTNPIGNQAGFTLVELLMAFLIISILATMGAMYMADLRNRSSDSHAYTEGRHILTALNDAFLADEDVDFDTSNGGSFTAGISGDIGAVTVGDTPRTPIFTVSDNVRVRMSGSNGKEPNDGDVTMYIWSTQGTPDDDAFNDDGKKEYQIIIVEATGDMDIQSF